VIVTLVICITVTSMVRRGAGPVSLRHQQPPRDNVSVPSVDDDLHVLVEQISFANSQCHRVQQSLTVAPSRLIPDIKCDLHAV
jgi:hypothetical protein